ncbi:MAG TPA: UDP-N-acetylmuramoyl-tripeptide--D-alanyl-D-alanine ligase [Actinocrinis sp.]|nr:UDP-N-acetylmuramoyl-tripeptide--D-alanyl-D-alanine ligase [Actinocrinis sp.]HZP50313.1 UDP-N-acetylmuramoyl-tripeptide--D-alanyl-D-alanine ligase [Actinocrinis sp.]
MTLAEIAQAVDGTLTAGTDGAVAVTGPVTVDSRAIEPGGLFAAFVGEHADGHDFAAAAVAQGAAGVLASRQIDADGSQGGAGPIPTVLVADVQEALGKLACAVVSRLPQTTVIGLTGSSGKTSTKDMLGQVLAAHGTTIAPKGSFNNEIGLPLTVLRADEDTRYLVLEMGSRGVGHLTYLCRIAPPSVGLVLNVGSAHVGEFGSKEQTALAKGELVEALPKDGLAVLNADDSLVAPMRERTVARVLTFGESAEADVRASGIELGPDGRASFLLHADAYGEPASVALRVVGEHQVANALAVATAALGLGLPMESVARELSAAVPLSSGRMAVSERADGVVVIDDAYNANPESVRAALKALAALARARPGARSWAVLGEMLELGERSGEEHDAIGRLAVRLRVDRLVAVGEGAARVHAGASHEGSWGEESVMVADPDAALALLREQLRPGDVVLVKASNSIGLGRVAKALLDDDLPDSAADHAAGAASGPAEGDR